MRPLIKWLNSCDYTTVASCCGHGKYPMTIVVMGRRNGVANYAELFSGIELPRNRRFYKKDNEGFYFIPETVFNSTSATPTLAKPKEFNKDLTATQQVASPKFKILLKGG